MSEYDDFLARNGDKSNTCLTFRFNGASFEDLDDWVRNKWGSIEKTRVKIVEIFGR